MKDFFQNFHALKIERVLEIFQSNPAGLSSEEAKKRQIRFGENKLPEEKKIHPVLIFFKQFQSALVYVLIGAALVSYFIGAFIDVYIITAVIVGNAAIGFFYQRRAEHVIETLKKLIVVSAKVYRDGELLRIPFTEVVPGDIIFLENGDKVPADGRLIETKNLLIDESLLTGESFPQEKDTKIFPETTALGDRKNMVWMGTVVVRGQAKAVVTATANQTAIGQIAQSIAAVKREPTHFEIKTRQLAFQMGLIAAAGAFVTFLIGFLGRGVEFSEIFLFSVASLVSGIPEGLPAVLTVVLAVGARRMAAKQAVIRYLPAVETLGVATIIATDKTGTLTQNSMMVKKIVLPQGKEIDVSGSGWEPKGLFSSREIILHPLEDSSLRKLLQIVAICNNGRLIRDEGNIEIIGDPTEAALVVLAEKAGLKKEELLEEERKFDELPFDENNKFRAVLVEHEKHNEIYVVGAFEKIISLLEMEPKFKSEIIRRSEELAKKSMRVLAAAYREVSANVKKLSLRNINHLSFAGVVGMTDPPRPEVKEAIAKARQAGVRVVMKTGDHKETAVAVGREIGLLEGLGETDKAALTEEDLLRLSPAEFERAVRTVSIFARLTPAMKMKVVETLQKQGEIVAMTGDGVNDAPALKKADIGVAMGIIGTDVARESSQIVLADDNFASIVNAVEEGRIVFNNVRHTSFYLITTNVAEYVTIIASLFLGLPLPLLPIHVLWLNLITDGTMSTTLAVEPGHNHELQEPPRPAKEGILSKEVLPFIFINALLMAAATIFFFIYALETDINKARTLAFTLMALFQLFNAFNMRSLKKSVFKIGFLSNRYILIGFGTALLLQIAVLYVPFLRESFRFVPLTLTEWLAVVLICSSVLWLGEIYKFFRYRVK